MKELHIIIDSIPHSQQRYDTCGDWRIDEFKDYLKITVKVSQLSDPRRELCVGLHEAIEALICHSQGVTGEMVDTFDFTYEISRPDGKAQCGCKHYDEPGDDPHAPYHVAHQQATLAEEAICDAFGIDWFNYESEIDTLEYKK